MDIDFKVEHTIKQAEPVHVTVERGQRGGYGWTIKFYGGSIESMLVEIKYADAKLRELFLVPEGVVKDESKEHTVSS